jgi:hypothetical protein
MVAALPTGKPLPILIRYEAGDLGIDGDNIKLYTRKLWCKDVI